MKSSLDILYAETAQFKLLTLQEEIELARQIKQGNIKAFHKLVTANLRLVGLIAEHYRYRYIDFEDIIAAGYLGLVEVAWRYDETRGNKLAAYAGWWIRKEIGLAIIEYDVYHISQNIRDKFSKYNRTWEYLEQQLHRDPTIEELVDAMKIPINKVERIIRDLNTVFHFSIDQPIDNSTTIPVKDTYICAYLPDIDTEQQAKDILNCPDLSRREKNMLELYYLYEYTYKKIGAIFVKSDEWARIIIKNAIAKLKKSPYALEIVAA